MIGEEWRAPWKKLNVLSRLGAVRWSISRQASTWAAKVPCAETNYMSGRVFIDTNILGCAYDLDAADKRSHAMAVIQGLWET